MDDDYKKMTNDELVNAYEESLDEYTQWVNKNIPLHYSWEPELFHIVCERDDLCQIEEELNSREIVFDSGFRDQLDDRWKDQIKHDRDASYVFTFDRSDEPKEKWWWWIDVNTM